MIRIRFRGKSGSGKTLLSDYLHRTLQSAGLAVIQQGDDLTVIASYNEIFYLKGRKISNG